MANELRSLIREIADELDFLPLQKLSSLISNLIIEALPDAVLEIEDKSLPSSIEMKDAEFKTQRSGGKPRDEINEEIEHRKVIYREVLNAKSAMVTELASRGGSLLAVAIKDHNSSYHPHTVQSSLSNVVNQYMGSSRLFNTLAEEDRTEQNFATPRGSNLHYVVDDAVVARINEDRLFRIFCASIEEPARRFAAIHRNEWTFRVKESKNLESPLVKRTILQVQFTRVNFDTSLKLWSALSKEVRGELDKALSKLHETDQPRFREYMSKFNVVLDY